MSKEKETNEIEKYETRRFRYSNQVTFEFDLDVSDPESAVAEITDFIELMKLATNDLEALRKDFATKVEKKEAPKKDEGTGASPGEGEGSSAGK
jgi:hypothetical protein